MAYGIVRGKDVQLEGLQCRAHALYLQWVRTTPHAASIDTVPASKRRTNVSTWSAITLLALAVCSCGTEEPRSSPPQSVDAGAPARDAELPLADVGSSPDGRGSLDADVTIFDAKGPSSACPDVRIGVDGSPRPDVIEHDYLDLRRIERISKFRSGIGHDYADAAETCRSMKHYLQPADMASADTVPIYAPFSGRVVRLTEEWAGTQVHVTSDRCHSYTAILFHVKLATPLAVGDRVTAGQALGTHIGPQTMSDIAVAETSSGFRLVSYFELMPDTLFDHYVARGVGARSDLVIAKLARDASPLTCSGEQFASEGTISNWVTLQ